jgi:hypothetical protein
MWRLLPALLLVSAGCVTAIPGPDSRRRVPADVTGLYTASVTAYLEEAEAALARARQAGGLLAANRHLAAAWQALEHAWDRATLAGSIAELTRVARATILADTGSIPDGLADGVSLFEDMMDRLGQTELAQAEGEAFSAFVAALHAVALESPTSFEELRRYWAIELALWNLEGRQGDCEHRARLLGLLAQAEHTPALRSQVPLSWLQEATEALQPSSGTTDRR